MAFQEVIGAGGCEPRSGCELNIINIDCKSLFFVTGNNNHEPVGQSLVSFM